jgi:hypothetical protein
MKGRNGTSRDLAQSNFNASANDLFNRLLAEREALRNSSGHDTNSSSELDLDSSRRRHQLTYTTLSNNDQPTRGVLDTNPVWSRTTRDSMQSSFSDSFRGHHVTTQTSAPSSRNPSANSIDMEGPPVNMRDNLLEAYELYECAMKYKQQKRNSL